MSREEKPVLFTYTRFVIFHCSKGEEESSLIQKVNDNGDANHKNDQGGQQQSHQSITGN